MLPAQFAPTIQGEPGSLGGDFWFVDGGCLTTCGAGSAVVAVQIFHSDRNDIEYSDWILYFPLELKNDGSNVTTVALTNLSGIGQTSGTLGGPFPR